MTTFAVTTRPVADADAPLLFELFLSGEAAAWTAMLPQMDNGPVLRRMFASQQADYTAAYPQAHHDVILIDGAAAGQVRWAELDDEIALVDIAVLPQYRRRGAAAAILTQLVAYARGAGKPVRSMVTRVNAASLALHHRTGFATEGESPTHYFLVARSGASAS